MQVQNSEIFCYLLLANTHLRTLPGYGNTNISKSLAKLIGHSASGNFLEQ